MSTLLSNFATKALFPHYTLSMDDMVEIIRTMRSDANQAPTMMWGTVRDTETGELHYGIMIHGFNLDNRNSGMFDYFAECTIEHMTTPNMYGNRIVTPIWHKFARLDDAADLNIIIEADFIIGDDNNPYLDKSIMGMPVHERWFASKKRFSVDSFGDFIESPAEVMSIIITGNPTPAYKPVRVVYGSHVQK